MIRVIVKRCLGRRRICWTFFIVLSLSVWYVCYQAMSVHKLGKELTAEHVHLNLQDANGDLTQDSGDDKSNRSQLKDHGIRIRGLLPKYIKNYIPNSRGNFICFHSEQEVPYNRVNNDYCDCEDGTDEPSTSACSNGRFYCDYQPPSGPVYIVSSRVNDGICDCKDGSDEWANIEVPGHVKISEYYEEKLGIDQAPCHNRIKYKST